MIYRVKKIISLTMCFLFCFTLISHPVYAAKGTPGQTVGTVTGKVTLNGTKDPIKGAAVTLKGSAGVYSVITDSKGSYSITVSTGTYDVTCEAAGFNTYNSSVTTKNGTITTLNIALTKAIVTTGNISGTITNAETGIPLAGVSVTAAGSYAAVTDSNGGFSITNVAEGNYELKVIAEGYLSQTKSVSVIAGQTAACSFGLEPIQSEIKITSLIADPDNFIEDTVDCVNLSAVIEGNPAGYSWEQVGGPKASISATDAGSAAVDVTNLNVAVDVELVFQLTVTDQEGKIASSQVRVFVEAADMMPFLGQNVQIGGSTTAVSKFSHNGTEWAIFNIGSKLCTTPIGINGGQVYKIYVSGFVNDIDLVTYLDRSYALLSAGTEGIVVVDITDPENMEQVSNLHVNYYKDGLNFTEGGGAILYDNVISGIQGHIAALETDGTELYIADTDFGIHRTKLENLLGTGGPVLEPDGTLLIDEEVFTLQYAGENPWGGPVELKLYNDKLFVCLKELGLGIFDPVTLKQVGGYNLYTDTTVKEDWFVDMDIRQAVQKDPVTSEPYVDSFTGMPDYRQTSFEILQVMKNEVEAPTPWADFDRSGKYYYKAQSVDIAEFHGRTIAYIAYSLGGLVAVDISGFERAGSENFMKAKYLGYVPAVPANGPKEPTGTQSQSLLPYQGAGMLKESGVVDVQVRGDKVYLTDHFAGLMIINNAGSPDLTWRGGNAPYNNDDDGILGNHWPDYEFITSYDMSPWDPSDNESMPKWMYQEPCLLVTAEINGHGNKILLMDEMAIDTAGNIDLLECAGAGGFNFIDIINLSASKMEDRYAVPVYIPSTDEIGARPDGTPGQTMAIGHSQGIAASDNYIYVSDGPHGITAWNILDNNGYATDDIHIVANTLQDEYPEIVNGVKIYPASHSTNVVYDPVNKVAWSGSASLGLRRVNVARVEAGEGQTGNPLLLPLSAADCFEHNGEFGTVKGIQFQDHAYDVEIKGNYAFVADGSNGLTVYDYTKDPTDVNSGFLVSNIGAGKLQPPLGTASGIALWTDPVSGNSYAFVACGPRGVGVVDITDIGNMKLVKVFEPIKLEDEKVGAADGQAIDVKVAGNYAYFSYDSFGVVCYSLADLIEPLKDGISPTEVWKKSLTGKLIYDYRPIAVSRFKLQTVPGYEDWAGGAFKMDYTLVNGKLVFYVAFGEAGVIKIDWTDPDNPLMKEIASTVSECTAVAISNGRLFVADGGGGLIFFK